MPTRPWPRKAIVVARALQVGVWTWAAAAGLNVAWPTAFGLEPPQHVPIWAVGLGLMSLVGGAFAAVATVRDKWTTEWVAAWFVLTAYACYGAIDSSRLLFGPPGAGDLGGIAVLGSAACAVGWRVVYLWVFYIQTSESHDKAAAAESDPTDGGDT